MGALPGKLGTGFPQKAPQKKLEPLGDLKKIETALARKECTNSVRIHGHDDTSHKIADVADQSALEPVHEAGMESMFQVLMDCDGFVGCIEEVESDLNCLHDRENQSQQKDIVDETHYVPPCGAGKSRSPCLHRQRR